MTRRWGLQATMTATYVAVTAGVVLLTELVIFGVAALSPPTPLTPQAVQGLAQVTATGTRRKLAKVAPKLSAPQPAGLAADLITGGGSVASGQARPDGDGGVVIPQLTTAACDLAPASFAVIVSTDRHRARAPPTRRASRRAATAPTRRQGVPRKVLASFVRWPVRDGGQAPLPVG